MNNQQLKEQVAKLLAENEALKAAKPAARELTFKVGQKRGVSVYGFGRFPITLYLEQWIRLEARFAELMVFIRAADARGELAHQGDAPVETGEPTTQPGSGTTARQAAAIAELMAESNDAGPSKAELMTMLAAQTE